MLECSLRKLNFLVRVDIWRLVIRHIQLSTLEAPTAVDRILAPSCNCSPITFCVCPRWWPYITCRLFTFHKLFELHHSLLCLLSFLLFRNIVLYWLAAVWVLKVLHCLLDVLILLIDLKGTIIFAKCAHLLAKRVISSRKLNVMYSLYLLIFRLLVKVYVFVDKWLFLTFALQLGLLQVITDLSSLHIIGHRFIICPFLLNVLF